MPKFRVEFLEEMSFVIADGTSVEDAKKVLQDYLSSVNETAQKFYFIESYRKGNVQGAMVLAQVNKDLEPPKGLRKYTYKPSDYLIIEATYEEYILSANGDSSVYNTNQYLKENKMKMMDFPISETYQEDGIMMVRSYIPVKYR